MKKILLFSLLFCGEFLSAQLVISEILVSPPGTDSPNEFIELRGVPGATIPANTYLVQIEGDGASNPGDIELPASGGVIDLSGKTLGRNGFLVILTSDHTYTVDPNATILTGVTDGSLEDYSHTFLLVNSPTVPTTSDDIDSDNDGIPDGTLYNSWTILDGISVLDNDDLNGGGEFGYADLVFCKCTSTDANIFTKSSATVVYTGTKQFEYFARVGESTGSSLTSNPSTTDWFGGDLSTSRTSDTNNYIISTFSGKAYPIEYGGLEINNVGSANHIVGNNWLGTDTASPNDWNTSTNWSFGTVPISSDYIFINKGLTNYPTTSTAVVVKSVFMEPGSSLIAQSNFLGEINYQREISYSSNKLKNWFLMSSPVFGQNIDDNYIALNDVAISGNNCGVASFNTLTSKWNYHQAEGDALFNLGNGYAVKKGTSSENISFKGSLNTNNLGVNIVLNNTGKRFNLLGNPYPSYLKSSTLLQNSSISETKTIWIYNHSLGLNGGYEARNLLDDFILAPTQGFFVKSNSAGGTFNFSETSQQHYSTDTFRKIVKKRITLSISDGKINHKTDIYYIDKATKNFDIGYDSELFGGVSASFEVYSKLVLGNQQKKLQIQALPNDNLESLIVPIHVNIKKNAEITFEIEYQNFEITQNIFLEDKKNNLFTQLNIENSNYKTLVESMDKNRFYLHTRQNVLSLKNTELQNIKTFKASKKSIKITGLNSQKISILMFNILGEKIIETTLENKTNAVLQFPKLANGIYIFQLKSGSFVKHKKIVFN